MLYARFEEETGSLNFEVYSDGLSILTNQLKRGTNLTFFPSTPLAFIQSWGRTPLL